MSRSPRSPFPFVPLDTAELHVEAEGTWGRLLADLASARKEILFESYILVDGDAAEAILDAMKVASARSARICILVDGAGSHALSHALRARLETFAEVRLFHPLSLTGLFLDFRKRIMTRTHRRIVVIDREVAWTGGMGFSDSWWWQGLPPFRETMLRLTGPVVSQLHTAFHQLWSGEELPPTVQQRPAHVDELRLLPQRAIALSCFRRGLRQRIGQAKRRAWLATAYFIPPRRLRRALRVAARRGVDVRLLLPGPKLHDHPAVRLASRRYYAQLLRAGVRIFEYQPSFQHSKAGLFDEEWSLIGTPNLDRWSFLSNHEIAIESRIPTLADDLEAAFESDFQQSREITLEMWRARSLWSRFLESFFGIFDNAF